MSARGSTWGAKHQWLRVITTGLQRLGGAETTLPELMLWLRSDEGRRVWPERPEPLPEGTIRNHLTLARRAFGMPDGLWSIGQTISGQHAIAPESLPVVALVARLAMAWGRPLTTRQAFWVARLAPLVLPTVARLSDEPVTVHLYGMAMMYAVREQLLASGGAGAMFDTADLDPYLMFGSAYWTDPVVAEGERAGVASALKLGVMKLSTGDEFATVGESGWLFTPDLFRLRLLAESGIPEPRQIRRWPLWKIVVVNLGLRVVASQPGFGQLTEDRQQEQLKALRDAVELNEWDTYRKVTGIPEVQHAKA